MPWPSPADIRTALANPSKAFRDPQLQASTIEVDEGGEPRTWSGSSAVVYLAILPDGTPLALRTFNAELRERRERYGWVSDYLKDRMPRCLVRFQYRDSGFRLAGDDVWYPLMVMDWVEGPTLLQYVRARCLAGKATSMAKAARHWAALIEELAKAQVVHGDLEHANVLVTKAGRLMLVDYDTMCVPALVGLPNLEVGVEPYRHPRRIASTPLSPELDNFAAMVIYAALRALAAAPRLWEKHVEQLGRDTLLFHGDDFRDPEASALYRDLRRSPDREVRRLAKIVFKAAAEKLNQTPPLAEVVKMISGSSHLAAAPDKKTAQGRGKPPVHAEKPGPGPIAYELGEVLGKGPLGTVYRAIRRSDGSAVALKIVHPAGTVSEADATGLVKRIESLRSLQHPGIAGLLDVGRASEDFYFVTRYCSGKSLTEAMASRGGRLSLAEAGPLFLQCLAALEYAHAQGFVHGDLKPENVLLENRGGAWFALIGDFGVARQFELAGISGLTAAGKGQRAYGFMPREQLNGAQNGLASSDLWSLAATFYHGLTGQYAYDFQDRDPAAVILHDDPLPLSLRNPTIPAPVAAAIDLALQTDPAARFPSPGAMIVALERAFAQAAGGLR